MVLILTRLATSPQGRHLLVYLVRPVPPFGTSTDEVSVKMSNFTFKIHITLDIESNASEVLTSLRQPPYLKSVLNSANNKIPYRCSK